jgi:hypothetical protein
MFNAANIVKRVGLSEKGLSFGHGTKTVNNTLKPVIPIISESKC